MTSGTDQGRTIERAETFVVSHTLNPRTGPSIALSDAHAYVLVKLTDSDGRSGWGETYLVPGVVAILEAVAPVVIGRSASETRALSRDIGWASEHTYAASAMTIAVEDLRARQLGVSVAASFGGPVREQGPAVCGVRRLRRGGPSEGHLAGRRPARPRRRVQRDEVPGRALSDRRGGAAPREDPGRPARWRPPDGRRERRLHPAAGRSRWAGSSGALGFTWFEEPLRQRDGYSGYEHLRAALDIALAGGEILQSRSAAVELLGRRAVDVVQPEPVICGGIADTLWIADLAATHTIPAMPHTSNNALGIAAGLQVLACLPDPTRSPASDELFLEVGVDDNPHRAGLLATPMPFKDGWATIPSGPGLGVEIDEAYLAHHAVSHTIIDAAGARPA